MYLLLLKGIRLVDILAAISWDKFPFLFSKFLKWGEKWIDLNIAKISKNQVEGFGLVWSYDISISVGYSMPNPFLFI